MKIALINPNTTVRMTATCVAAAEAVKAAGTDIIGMTSKEGPASIEGPYDEAFALPGLIRAALRAGFWRLHRLFSNRKIPVTVFAVGMAMARNPEAAQAMIEADWEIASHGYRWIDYRNVPEEVEREHIMLAMDAIRQACGAVPVGWYTGRTSENTRRLITEHGGFLYDADSYADELPYWDHTYGKPHLVVPYTLDANDMRFATPQGFNSGDQFFAYLKDSFDTLYAEGETAPKMMSVGLHCRLVGRPGRAAALARFLDYVQGHERVWLCRRVDIARHWAEHFPAKRA